MASPKRKFSIMRLCFCVRSHSYTVVTDGEKFTVHFLLDFLSLCESSGFIQLKLPLSELKKKVDHITFLYVVEL